MVVLFSHMIMLNVPKLSRILERAIFYKRRPIQVCPCLFFSCLRWTWTSYCLLLCCCVTGGWSVELATLMVYDVERLWYATCMCVYMCVCMCACVCVGEGWGCIVCECVWLCVCVCKMSHIN